MSTSRLLAVGATLLPWGRPQCWPGSAFRLSPLDRRLRRLCASPPPPPRYQHVWRRQNRLRHPTAASASPTEAHPHRRALPPPPPPPPPPPKVIKRRRWTRDFSRTRPSCASRPERATPCRAYHCGPFHEAFPLDDVAGENVRRQANHLLCRVNPSANASCDRNVKSTPALRR